MSAVHPETAAATLTVHLGRIVANYRRLSHCASAPCAAVVKANAYGLGAGPVALALAQAGCRDFCVAMLDEALALRAILGPVPRIIVLNGLPDGTETLAAEAGLTPVLNTPEQCRAWSRMARRPAVLQVDTGMSRFGLSAREQTVLLGSTTWGDLNVVLLMSHLANADEPGHPGNAAQLAAFRGARQRFPGIPASLANSAGIFLSPDFHFDLCRPGAALYGIDVGPGASGLLPVVELSATITQVRTIPAGVSVGYGYQFTAEREMSLALIPVGYADGWSRHLAGKGAAWLGGQRLPIVGRVSMDSFVVDISGVDALRPGQSVDLIGPHQDVNEVARLAGTIGYEVLTGLGTRFNRHYFES